MVEGGLADVAPSGLATVDARGVIDSANAVLVRWLGRPREEILGRVRLHEALTRGSAIYFQTHLLPMLRLNGEIGEAALQLRDGHGGSRDVLVAGRSFDFDGAAAFVLFAAEARRRFEREQAALLKAAEARAKWLHQVEAMGGVGAWAYSVADGTLRWSDRVFALHDIPPGAEPPLEEALACLDEGTRKKVRVALTRAATLGEPFAFEGALRSMSGRRHQIRVRGEAEWRRGAIDRVIGIVQDVTDQREAEAARLAAEATVSKLADNLPGVLVSLDLHPDGGLAVGFISSRCEELWGSDAGEIRSDPALLDAPHGTSAGILEALRDAVPRREPFVTRLRVEARAGDERWLEMRGSVTPLQGGLLRADCIFLDITREVAAQTSLARQIAIAQRAQKVESVGRLTGGIAHDFNNLLTVVLCNLEMLRDEIVAPQKLAMIDAALRATQRGAGLTKTMLAFASKARLEPAIFDLNAVVRELKGWAGRTLPANMVVETALARRLWAIRADVDATASALLNLLVNARDAMPDGGRLRVATANVTLDAAAAAGIEDLSSGRYVTLAVEDTGEGIADDVASRIFEPFFTTKPSGKGSGLGLSVVQGFMKQSGGAIRVASVPGQGTSFTLYFPAEAGPAKSPGRAAVAAPGPRAARILLAEDEAPVLAAVRHTLEKCGYEVTAAANGDVAKLIFDDDRGYDLLLTDVMMPGTLHGPALAWALRAVRPDLPVVFMTDYADDRGAADAFRAADCVLTKPVRRDDLVAAIESALAKRRITVP